MATSGKSDQLKGRVKEAGGALMDDDDLKKEGRIDKATGEIKEKAEEVVDEAKKWISGEKGDEKD